MTNLVMEDIVELMGQTLRNLIDENDFEMPVTAACISANGSAFILQFTWIEQENPGAGVDIKAINEAGEPALTPPLHALYVDATGLRHNHFILNEESGEWLH